MARCVLDKNPEQILESDVEKIKKILDENIMNTITYSDPFLKTIFISNLIPSIKDPIIYLDFDLLYSGYIKAGIISSIQNVSLLQPTKTNFNEMLKTILTQISKEKSIIIIDSLNGIFNLFNQSPDVGRLVNSFIMFFASIARMSNSKLVIPTMVRRNKENQLVLSVTGRQMVESKQMTKIHINENKSNLEMDILSNGHGKKYKFVIQSELF